MQAGESVYILTESCTEAALTVFAPAVHRMLDELAADLARQANLPQQGAAARNRNEGDGVLHARATFALQGDVSHARPASTRAFFVGELPQ